MITTIRVAYSAGVFAALCDPTVQVPMPSTIMPTIAQRFEKNVPRPRTVPVASNTVPAVRTVVPASLMVRLIPILPFTALTLYLPVSEVSDVNHH